MLGSSAKCFQTPKAWTPKGWMRGGRMGRMPVGPALSYVRSPGISSGGTLTGPGTVPVQGPLSIPSLAQYAQPSSPCHLPTKRLSPISRRGMAARPQTSRKSSNGPVLPTALNRGSLPPKLGCFIPAKNTESPQGTAPASPSSLAGGFLPFSLASSHPLSPYLMPVLLHLRHPSRPSLHKAGLLI